MSQEIQITIKSIAQLNGISSLKPSIISKLFQTAQDFIIGVIDEGSRLAMVRKRKKLTAKDINTSLRLMYRQPVMGADSYSDLIEAGSSEGLDLYTYDTGINDIRNSRSEIPPYPISIGLHFEWLCHNGSSLIELSAFDNQLESRERNYIQSYFQRQNTDTDISPHSNKHQFSYEEQVFFRLSRDRVLLKNSDSKDSMLIRESMLTIIQSEGYIKTLIPYYIKFCMIQMRDHSRSWDSIYASLSIIRALIQNDKIPSLMNYLTEIISIGLTYLISPAIQPSSVMELINVRNMAGEFFHVLIDRIWPDYPMAVTRLSEQLLAVLISNDSSIRVDEKYGAFIGLSYQGIEVTSKYLVPILDVITNYLITTPLRSGDRDTKFVASVMFNAINRAVGMCIHHDSYKTTSLGVPCINQKITVNHKKVFNNCGTDLLQYYIDDSALYYI